MNALNQIILEGNIVRDPVIKETPHGTHVCTMPIAVNRLYKDSEGNDVKEVGFYDIEAWEKLGDRIGEFGVKGRGVRVVGRLKQSRWKTNDGKPASKITIVAEHVEFKPIFQKKEADSAEKANLTEAAAALEKEQLQGTEVF